MGYGNRPRGVLATDIKAVSSCMECIGLSKDHVPSEGDVGAEVMVIGQSPGAREVETGSPFIGASGDLVNLLLSEMLLDRSEVYVANALKCHPDGNRKGLDDELANCWKIWLKEEIDFVDPKVIIMFGRDAYRSVIEQFPKAAEKLPWGHGNYYIRKTKYGQRLYVCSYHPAYYLRRGDYSDFLAVAEIVENARKGMK